MNGPERPDEAPFAALRRHTLPAAPRLEFTAALRQRLVEALRPTPPAAHRAPPRTTTTTADQETHMETAPLVPYLIVNDAARAIAWFGQVFGATETMRMTDPQGRVGHAEVRIGAAHLYLADEHPEEGHSGPTAGVNPPVSLHLTVPDVDATYRAAIDRGATSQREPADQGHGSRSATVVDPFGHRWMLAAPISADRAAAAEEERGAGGDGRDYDITGGGAGTH